MASKLLTIILLFLGILIARSLKADTFHDGYREGLVSTNELLQSQPLAVEKSSIEKTPIEKKQTEKFQIERPLPKKPALFETNITGEQCAEQKFPAMAKFKKIKGVSVGFKARVSFFEPFDSPVASKEDRKVLIFIMGKDRSFRQAQSLIKTFCVRGNFAVAAFDIIPEKKNKFDDRMYLKAARMLSKWALTTYPKRRFVLFGAGDGAQVALELERWLNRRSQTADLFQRVILANPVVDQKFFNIAKRLNPEKLRIYSCGVPHTNFMAPLTAEYHIPFLIPNSKRRCPLGVAESAETRFPFVSSVEADLSGVVHIASWRDWRPVTVHRN